MSCVTPLPFDVTRITSPKFLIAVVPSPSTVKLNMPPRMPIDALGVLTVTGESPNLLILPPTKRKTPLVALAAR